MEKLNERTQMITIDGKDVEVELNEGEFIAWGVDDPLMDVNDKKYLFRGCFKYRDACDVYARRTYQYPYSAEAKVTHCIFKVSPYPDLLADEELDIYKDNFFVSTVEDRVAIMNDNSILTTENYVNKTFGEHTGYISHSYALEPIKDGKKFLLCKEYVGNHNPFFGGVGWVEANVKIESLCGMVYLVNKDSHGCKEFEEISKEQVARLYEDDHCPAVINFYYDLKRFYEGNYDFTCPNKFRAVYCEIYACTAKDGKIEYELVNGYWAM